MIQIRGVIKTCPFILINIKEKHFPWLSVWMEGTNQNQLAISIPENTIYDFGMPSKTLLTAGENALLEISYYMMNSLDSFP